MELTDKAQANRNAIESIRHRMNSGELTYEQAQAEAQPIIDAMNARMAEISKEHGFKPKKLSFKYLMR